MSTPPIPSSVPGNVAGFLRTLANHLDREFRARTPDNAAQDSILLASPNGSVYSVGVDDAGNVVTTLVQG